MPSGNLTVLTVGTLSVTTLSAGTLNVTTLTVGTLSATSITAGTCNLATLTVGTLSVTTLSSGTLSLNAGSVSTLTVTTLSVTTLTAGTGNLTTLTVGTLSATTISSGTLAINSGVFSTITATTLSLVTITAGTGNLTTFTVGTLLVTTISAGTLSVTTLTAGTLSVNTLTVGTGRFTTLTSGTLSVTDNIVISTADKGIDFSANSSAAGMTSELFNHYETGTFSPTLKFGGNAVDMVATQTGYYTRIGNIVSIQISIIITTKGSSSGSATITGLPFTIAEQTACSTYLYMVSFANQQQSVLYAGQTVVTLNEITEAGTVTALANTDFSDGSQIYINATYRV